MRVQRSVLLAYPAESMFDIIEQAEYYPQFIPWCSAAEILERTEDIVAARVSMRVAGLQLALETRNPKRRPEWLHLRMLRGPLRRFEGDWRLTPLNATACRIDFTLSYEIGDGLIERVAGPAFARMADVMVDAYVARAERILPATAHLHPPTATEGTANDRPDTAGSAAPIEAGVRTDGCSVPDAGRRDDAA